MSKVDLKKIDSPTIAGPTLFSAKNVTSKSKHVELYSERFFRLDIIRVSKLLEIAQYAVISFWFNIVVGSFLDKLFPAFNPKKNIYLMYVEVTIQIAFLAMLIYYIKKLLSVIPFVFALTSKYIPNLKGEMNIGMSSAPLALIATQANLISKVKFLQSKFMRQSKDVNPAIVPAKYVFPTMMK